jgi:hypothetical protein
MRMDLTRRLLAHRFDAERLAMERKEHELAQAIYEHVYSKTERKQMDAMPKGYMPVSKTVHVRIGGEHVQLNMGVERPVPYSDLHRCQHVIGADDPLTKQWLEHRARAQGLRQRINEARAAIRGALASMRTFKQLKQHWPEAAAMLPAPEQPQLPALPIQKLNRMLEL